MVKDNWTYDIKIKRLEVEGNKDQEKIMLENDIMKPDTLYTNLELQVSLKVLIFFIL